MTVMEPLKVTFKVSGGFASPPMPLHFDALLAYQRTRQHMVGRLTECADMSIPALRALADHLPLEKHEQDGNWCWKASALMPVGEIELAGRFYTQRRDQPDYATAVHRGEIQHGRHIHGSAMKPYAYSIDTLRGVYRNLLGYYSIMKASGHPLSGNLELVCWCIGDKDSIESQLSDGLITHLGSRRRCGHGRIESMCIERDEDALENWKLRVRPWALMENDEPILAACQAPYWAVENRGAAYCPASLI